MDRDGGSHRGRAGPGGRVVGHPGAVGQQGVRDQTEASGGCHTRGVRWGVPERGPGHGHGHTAPGTVRTTGTGDRSLRTTWTVGAAVRHPGGAVVDGTAAGPDEQAVASTPTTSRTAAAPVRRRLDGITDVTRPGRIDPVRSAVGRRSGLDRLEPDLGPHAFGFARSCLYPPPANAPGLDTTAFPGDTLQVPVDPGIAAVLQRYPLPNDSAGSFGANTYATPSSVITNADQFSLRLDNAFSAKDQFFARFNIDNLTGPTTNPDQTAIDPSFGTTYIDRQRNVIGTWTRNVSPRLILVSSLSITRSTPGFPTQVAIDAVAEKAIICPAVMSHRRPAQVAACNGCSSKRSITFARLSGDLSFWKRRISSGVGSWPITSR